MQGDAIASSGPSSPPFPILPSSRGRRKREEPVSVKLGDLLKVLDLETTIPLEALEIEVRDIAHDSRKVLPGSLFVAVRGFHSDGHQFIPQAIRQGAIAVVTEQKINVEAGGAPFVAVNDSRKALALLADAFFNHPSERLKLVGVTGTNGKTTTTYLVKSIVEAAHGTVGLIGTIDYRVGGKVYPAPNTTPESLDLQRLMSEMTNLGIETCIMEVSSHALALGRTVGCRFAVAAFTNLTQDHLDFHETMDSYFEAKILLFKGLGSGACAVINIDDTRATDIISVTKTEVITTGFSPRADVRPLGVIHHGIQGLAFEVTTPLGPVTVESPLVGRHNIYNILTAIGIGVAMGFETTVIAEGVKTMQAVPGRMEKIGDGRPFGVIVDYAHTEDALNRLLEAVREIAEGQVITVFGCGGDRDRTKRPKMGRAAAMGSDMVIITSDNPRTEDTLLIIREIEEGMASSGVKVANLDAAINKGTNQTPYLVIPDRRDAIRAAIGMGKPGDIIVLAGKGHEDYQIIGDKKVHFDDREVARDELQKKRGM
jgi:UDP-N-acetylmuramoyl-L-alanyl-D-glutamate--2,6-diaminopimelate ligase